MRSSLRTALLATGILTSVALCAQAQELVTADRVGKRRRAEHADDAAEPRPVAEQPRTRRSGALYAAAWQKWAEAHPDWQVQFEFFSQDIGAEHARLLEQARAGRAPDCVTVDSFQLALFVKNGVLQPLDEFFTKEEIDDLFPFIRAGHHRPGRPNLRLVVGHRPARALLQHRHREDAAADLGRAAGDRARSRRRPASTACSSTAGAGRAPPSTGWPTSGPRAASSSTTAASRSSARARTARRC